MKRTNSSLPTDIIAEFILPRLPAKVLVRFKCVSKHWLQVISSDRRFLSLQYRHALSTNIAGYVVNGELLSTKFTKLGPQSLYGFPNLEAKFDGAGMCVLASCNGILCVAKKYTAVMPSRDSKGVLFLGNPVRGDWKRITHENAWTCHLPRLGLYVHENDSALKYKLVVPLCEWNSNTNNKFMFNVFSSATQEWKVSDQAALVDIPICFYRSIHCICLDSRLFWNLGSHVLFFDAKDDSAGSFPIPFPHHPDQECGVLGVQEGKLGFMIAKNLEIKVWHRDLSESSWVFLHAIDIMKINTLNYGIFSNMYFHMNLRSGKAGSPNDVAAIVRKMRPFVIFFGDEFLMIEVNGREFFYDMASGRARMTKFKALSEPPLPYSGTLLKLSHE